MTESMVHSLSKGITIHLSDCHLIKATMACNHIDGVIICGIFLLFFFLMKKIYKHAKTFIMQQTWTSQEKMKSYGLPVSVTNYHPLG